jgi:signal transduction histidine kinase
MDPSARLLGVLEVLLQSSAADLQTALSHAADVVARALRADKVDAFLHDPARASLVAVGVSHQTLSEQEKRLGLDVLPLANGGRVVQVFETGETYVDGKVDRDPNELRGIKEALAVRSSLGVPLDVGGTRRGVLLFASQTPDFFADEDVRFARSVARWVGSVAHRAELVEEIARNAADRGRQAVAEELITVLAHDLRNYLSPIAMRLTLLRRRAAREQREADVADADASCKALSQLTDLIGDILDVARIDRGMFALDLRPVDLVELIHETAQALTTPEHGYAIHATEELVVAADRRRLRQCLANLLANAFQHSPAAAPVEVEVTRTSRQEGEVIRVEIANRGPGIPEDLLPHIFERFVTSQGGQGLGLGLYLARRIARLHGGELTAESAPGKGARFALTLPYALSAIT